MWADVYVPKLIFAPKWYKDDESLKEGDLVYMKKSPDTKLCSKWVIGIVEQLIHSRDGKVRRVVVKYQNASEFPVPQFTDRAVRQLVKIFDVEEYVLQDDLTELMRNLEAKRKDRVNQDEDVQEPQAADPSNYANPTSVSGTWLQHPVPNLFTSEEERLEGDAIVLGEEGTVDEVGDWCQVSDWTTPSENYPSLVSHFGDIKMPSDNVVSEAFAESFAFAASRQQSLYTETKNASDMNSLMELISGTDMNMF